MSKAANVKGQTGCSVGTYTRSLESTSCREEKETRAAETEKNNRCNANPAEQPECNARSVSKLNTVISDLSLCEKLSRVAPNLRHSREEGGSQDYKKVKK